MDCCGTETAGVNDSLYVGVAAHGQFPPRHFPSHFGHCGHLPLVHGG